VQKLFAALVVTLALVPASTAAAPVHLTIIFQEGLSVRQMVDRVAVVRGIAIRKRHVTPALTGAAYARAAQRTKPLFGNGDRVEGFLFPDTYFFDASTTASQLVARQVATFRSRWKLVRLNGRNPYQVLTVASMIERETVVPSERALVSAVIWNRLRKGMALFIDATIRYGLGVPGTRPLTRTQLADPTPYNTRVHKGLPPTPIANPGLASMRAAAAPAAVDYLYYVRKPNSVHHFFTADEAEFCQKAKEYGYGC
jgi:UPF0755 protein